MAVWWNNTGERRISLIMEKLSIILPGEGLIVNSISQGVTVLFNQEMNWSNRNRITWVLRNISLKGHMESIGVYDQLLLRAFFISALNKTLQIICFCT